MGNSRLLSYPEVFTDLGATLKKTQHTKEYKRLISELRSARKAAGYTQLEAAAALDKHPPFISKIESGERRIDVVELATICRLYQIKLASLLRKSGLD